MWQLKNHLDFLCHWSLGPHAGAPVLHKWCEYMIVRDLASVNPHMKFWFQTRLELTGLKSAKPRFHAWRPYTSLKVPVESIQHLWCLLTVYWGFPPLSDWLTSIMTSDLLPEVRPAGSLVSSSFLWLDSCFSSHTIYLRFTGNNQRRGEVYKYTTQPARTARAADRGHGEGRKWEKWKPESLKGILDNSEDHTGC